MRKIYLLPLLVILTTSCARQISTDVYSSRQVGEVAATYSGIIKNIRPVTVENGENLEDNSLGMIGGGVAGGAVGDAIGHGSFFGKAVGAVCGALTGALVEKKMKRQIALEYIVQIEDGSLMTIVQGQDQSLYIGQNVYVLVGKRSRIIPQ